MIRNALPNRLRAVLSTIVCVPALLAGCASMAPTVTRDGAQASVSGARAYQENIDLGGRLSVRYQNNGKEEAVHGSFVWNQNPARTSIALLTPLGQTVASIELTPQGATLTQSGRPPRSAADVDALVADTLGWPLPISGMRDWLQGYATDAAGSRFIASPQSSAVTTRDGWQISYASWDNQGPAAPRPRRIDLSRQTAQAGDVALRLIIDTWQ
jgi:outer membrane lipoprotein LolB